jgi:nucleoside-diphosphate-sugar epimerase
VLPGDLTNTASVAAATHGVAAAIHLAALLPPVSERDRKFTFAVNVVGTATVAEALKETSPAAPLVFSSSVSTYGDTTGSEWPVTVDHHQQALDVYAESKIAAEWLLRDGYPNASILRISGISVPTLQSPPDVWPFMAGQRIEFIHRDDAVAALCAAVSAEAARGRIFNVAGGSSWRTTGREYVRDYFALLEAPIEEASFQKQPGWCDWYDTEESERILGYQRTPYRAYLDQIRSEIDKILQE